MNIKDLISELLEYPMDAIIEIIVGGDSLSVSEVKQQYGFSEYVKITTDTDNEKLIDKDELGELKEEAEKAKDLEEEVERLNEKINLIVSSDE